MTTATACKAIQAAISDFHPRPFARRARTGVSGMPESIPHCAEINAKDL